MSRRAIYIPYKPKTILNKQKRADHFFWTRYSAYPYIGCQHGCDFCYCREQKYSPYDDPHDFSYVIKVKQNAANLLHHALSRVEVDLVFTGDYQPVERKFGVSRKMLEVCLDLGFPVFVLERSPLVLRDIELLHEINRRAPSVVAFSVIAAPDSPHYTQITQIEHLAPPAAKRFAAMEAFAMKGILTGTCLMPILPGLCDDAANLEAVVRSTADHGGKFVLPGSLTLADQQKTYFLEVLQRRYPDLVDLYQRLYPQGSYGPQNYSWNKVASHIRELCDKYGISDRIPRPIIPGDKRARNKGIVEKLAQNIYDMEIHQKPTSDIWAFRKAAWAIEDMSQDIGLVYKVMGLKGLQSIPDVGLHIGKLIEKMLIE